MGIKLPSFKRIYEEDFAKEYQELVSQLAVTINYGFEPVYELLNGKFSISSNTNSIIKEFTVEVDANGKPKAKITLGKDGTDRLEGLLVIRAENLTKSSVYPTGGIHISYTETTSNITINHITGLPVNNIFQIKVLGIR